jgi:DNA invertase Pin-like site-specific DNA recombinase
MADGKERERQDPEVQLLKLRNYVEQHGYEVSKEYVDRASGTKMSRPALDEMTDDAHARRFEKILIVRLARDDMEIEYDKKG